MKLFVLMYLLVSSFTLQALESIKLKDTIKKGWGEINLFEAQINKKDPDAATLEAFRQSNNGKLVFAVDINEAANGTEKAQTQGVTIKSAVITIISAGITTQYSQYSTPTTTLVAEENQTSRSSYYTLIGETGSARITGSTDSDIYGSSFDGTLTFEVNDDISQATEAVLSIELLQTNTSLGDPEAFYDFTGGYEDVALITPEDKTYLDNLAPGVSEAPLVIAQSQINNPVESWVYYPSSSAYYVVSYEDNYPERGDYDFNDLVIGYRVGFGMNDNDVVSVIATGYMIARGASYTHDWYLHLPFLSAVSGVATINIFQPESTSQITGYPITQIVDGVFDIKVLKNSKALMNIPGEEFVNTLEGQTLIKGHKFSIAFDLTNSLALTKIPAPPYDPYIYTEVTGHELHLPGNATRLNFSQNSGSANTEYKDSLGYPYALVFPDDWLPPIEKVDIGEAYEEFLNYTLSSGSQSQSWYLTPKAQKTKSIGSAFWKW
ncbi:LruC domain-containing protein [Pseudoalteromonas denitrificans]|uniref:LruC domain-containing protein n=1 Tax=Pseudoalteromonas denitrificans DSM 6059 TaxID=1123010 RepID=A0A1I1UFY3_9GAMM|nr:LruC domain-containing protein [Pseudoalteromonas denitrificans]SFD69627.1 LruC domain-containing protein [Pseudoalteromonas denitrificans DSM 6059]